jgi:hypothetical protein
MPRNYHVTTFMFDKESHEWLHKLARDNHMSRSACLRMLVRNAYLDAQMRDENVEQISRLERQLLTEII